MTYVKKVKTNIRGMTDKVRDYTLGALTLLSGPSGSGKTSIVDAVCLGLTGEASSELGKAPANLQQALPESSAKLVAEVELSTGKTVTWQLAAGSRSASMSVLEPCGEVVSSGTFKLLLGLDKGRMLAILNAASLPIQAKGISDIVQSIDKELALRLEGMLPTDGTEMTAERYSTLLEGVESLKRKVSAELKSFEAQSEHGMSASDLEELEKYEKALLVTDLNKGQLYKSESELEALSGRIADLKGHLESIMPRYIEKRMMLDSIYTASNESIEILSAKTNAESGACMLCGRREDRASILAALEKSRGNLASAGMRIQEMDTEGMFETLRELEQRQHDLQVRAGAFMELAATSSEAIDTARLAALRAKRAFSAASAVAVVQASLRKRWEKELDALVNAIMDMPADVLPEACDIVRRRANKLLPRNWHVSMASSGRKVSIKLCRETTYGHSVRALSGSEQAILSSALAGALCPARKHEVTLLIIDEMMIDKKTLKTVMTGLSHIEDLDTGPTQVLVCASDWSGKLPNGWTGITLQRGPEEPEVADTETFQEELL